MKKKLFVLQLAGIGKPQKTFFFQRRDGSIFACGVKEAYEISQRFTNNGMTLVGVGDGSTFINSLKKACKKQDDAIMKIDDELETAKEEFADGLIGSDEFRVIRASAKKRRLKVEQEAFSAFKRAQEEEQKAAIGHIEPIPDLSYRSFSSLNSDADFKSFKF